MTKAALQPIHHILVQEYTMLIDKLYVSFNIEAEKHEYDLVILCGMTFLKLMALVLFLAPYIAIRIVLRAK